MRVLLILPDGHIHKVRIGPFVRSMREAPLTLTTLAALIPEELNFGIKLVDENVEKVPADYPADLVGISVLTGTATRAYMWANHFRDLGVPVVLGGVHVKIAPDEALQYASSILVGPAENTWPQLLKDFNNGQLQRIYRDDSPPTEYLKGIPSPRRDLQLSRAYNISNTTMATRGCRHACEFCSVPVVWPGYSRRPIADVVMDIRSMTGRLFTFNDVSLVDDVDYAKELFKAIMPLKRRWGALATVRVAKDPELIELMARSGCRYLLTGFESVSQLSLKEISKGFNQEDEYKSFMEILHAHGISVQGCFMFGFDHDDLSVFEETVQRVIDLKVDIPRYSILTPYPGTALYERLQREERILSVNWEDYDTMHVVFQPARMSPEDLYSGFKWTYKETFKIPHIMRRMRSLSLMGMINFVGNMTYRRFVKELYTSYRYSVPYSPDSISTESVIGPRQKDLKWHM